MNKRTLLVITLIAAATALFLASSCTTSTNSEPVIASLEPEAGQVVSLGNLQVVCAASDPDGDELSYDWSASAGEINGGGDTVTWTAPASEGSYSVAVVVTDGRGGQATDSVTIAVRTNNPPTITSLIASAEWTAPSGNLQVTCFASDLDGDQLSYDWSAAAGDISGTGSVVSWTAPQEVGTYVVTVVVTDDYGGSATRTVSLSVLTGQPPTIEALLVTADHCYLKISPLGYLVGKEQEYHIECIVPDTSVELSYEWSCTDGEISETSQDGSVITWIAPDEHIYVTIAVAVSDIAGNMANEDVFLEVVDCSYCTFGC
jgi:phage baseplate assembly protein gpV